uniref:Beta-lactamase-related domain-containing protein n=1 Tax=Noctiluca scintillans TaxID=2966 RepID=A0A7S1AUZ2_NOCSC|mmetsp:Transcript_61368/g.163184  ORF Transcript_61368/g.163184 Transcript_61368/m.163184 type:complete len:522 (+) Transcript_61368:36-1601(+)
MAPRDTSSGGSCPLGVRMGDPVALGVDLAPIKNAVQRLKLQVDDRRLPGFLTCVIKQGQLVHFDAYGKADVCAGESMRSDTMFRLYSQTKPLTVVGFMRLLERGVVHLEDNVSKYIPNFGMVTVGDKRRSRPLSRAVTLRDLLAHTSGVGFGPGFGYAPEGDYEKTYVDLVRRVDSGEISSLAHWCDELAKLPLRFQPGKDWGYGYSSDILGRVVEVASGKPLDVFIHSEVTEPLGMKDTAFSVPTHKAHQLATLYAREPWDGRGKTVRFVTVDPGSSGLTADSKKRVLSGPSDGNGLPSPSSSVFLSSSASKVIQGGGCVCSVAGGLVSTMGDYSKFCQMLLNRGEFEGVRLLRPETVDLLARDWLNDFSPEKRRHPLWVWGTPGIGFSPLGQIGVEHPKATSRRVVGSQLHTVHWGGAGGSGYMLNWPHQVVVLTYTGCTYDTATQKLMWRATFGALRRGGAKPSRPLVPLYSDVSSDCPTTPSAKRRRVSEELPRSSRKTTGSSTKRRRLSASTPKSG